MIEAIGLVAIAMVMLEKSEKLEISVTLEKYRLFSSSSEVTFTIAGEDHHWIIDQLLDAVEYFSHRYDMELETVK